MIQFNLLPNVKQEYVKAKRNKRLTLLVAVLVAGTALAIMVMLFLGKLVQDKHSSDLSKDIKSQSSELENTKDLDKILTIQSQLASLPALHDDKPVATRLLGYIKQVTPSKVSFASMEVNFDDQSMHITGSADSLATINTFVDTLKFTTYKTEDGHEGNAFSAVVLTSFGRDTKGASYDITFKYESVIFSNASPVTLNVPAGKITTRSETEKPEALFQPLSNPEGTQ